MNLAVVLSTAETNRNTDMFDVFVQRRIPELGRGYLMPLEVAEFPLCYVFFIETENVHDTVPVLASHEVIPRPLKGHPDLEEI